MLHGDGRFRINLITASTLSGVRSHLGDWNSKNCSRVLELQDRIQRKRKEKNCTPERVKSAVISIFICGECIVYLPGCGANFTADTGRVVSPNYPANYPDRSNCNYIIDAGERTVVILTFKSFQVEGKPTCGGRSL